MDKILKNKGITLISLVITIIILLILAGVSISTLVNNGIIDKAKTATQEYKNAQDYEDIQIAKYTNDIDSYVSGNRDYETEINKLKARITELENANSYSTTEKVVGTWTNGKPIYQISFENISFNGNNGRTIYTFSSGDEIDNLIYGWFQRQTYNGATSNNAKASIPLNIFSSNGTTNVSGYVEGASGISTGTITIQYTKASDTVTTD